jgi:hypothetical protein
MSMYKYLMKAASILAFVIGAMAVFSGGQVLLGKIPDYYVIEWLPVYNFTIGVITLFITAVLIWKNSRFAFLAAVSTFTAHLVVMVILQTSYANLVAIDSIRAMIIRITVWTIILSLMLLQRWGMVKRQAAKTQMESELSD